YARKYANGRYEYIDDVAAQAEMYKDTYGGEVIQTAYKGNTEFNPDRIQEVRELQEDGSWKVTVYDEEGKIAQQYYEVKKLDTSGPNHLQYESREYLETYIYLNNGYIPVDLSTGFNIVMLDNYYEDDKSLEESELKEGNYGERGNDIIKGKYFIIVDGEIVQQGIGSPHASVTSRNAYRDIVPGEYVIAGEDPYQHYVKEEGAKREQQFGRYMRLFKDEQQMKAYYSRQSWDTTISAEYTGGPQKGQSTTQSSILLHWMTGERSCWNGSLGCQVMQGFNKWSNMNYTLQQWNIIRGKYYLVDKYRPWKK
ncbi:MAG: hypothetical protein GYA16_04500, partial [Spirochaetes bacterium]|nr:hypothetical protein [Spirochaetota bacterium]